MAVPTLAILAGSPPVAIELASVRRIHQRSRDQSCRAARRSFVHTDAYHQAWPQADRGHRVNPTSASQNPRQNPHSARGTAATHLPRFRALALFGRRPPQRVDGFVIPASKNLHNCGLMHCTKVGEITYLCLLVLGRRNPDRRWIGRTWGDSACQIARNVLFNSHTHQNPKRAAPGARRTNPRPGRDCAGQFTRDGAPSSGRPGSRS